MRPWISRSAVSCEHFSSVAHFVVVSFPVKPSNRRLITSRCRSFTCTRAYFS
jgi:hypothetical protein